MSVRIATINVTTINGRKTFLASYASRTNKFFAEGTTIKSMLKDFFRTAKQLGFDISEENTTFTFLFDGKNLRGK